MRLPLFETELVLELWFSLPPAGREPERKFKLVVVWFCILFVFFLYCFVAVAFAQASCSLAETRALSNVSMGATQLVPLSLLPLSSL